MALLVSSVVLAACGTTAAPAEPDVALGTTVEEEHVSVKENQENALANCPEIGENAALVEDAKSYAEDQTISDEEAVRRMRLQNCFADDLSDLERELKKKERDSFAGLWIQHEPEYRFVVLFTQGGSEKIRPYVKGEPYAPLVEVRSGADAALPELHAAQSKAGHLVERVDLSADSSLNIMKNRVELYVLDRRKADNRIARAGYRLPEHVVLVEMDRLAIPE
jgi:hypothetical protein